ncbi:hypothetical protein SBRY_10725 [Actinacidiphila bryophytorum]|uniref:Uncharacterized protein n=1 Tax=Actinacidiphila bryophytorum TaxID=1436133 RepID=A0A9W4GXF4_9ACTN|nr:hypothetical protein SBRY_10725 [Actinacidiphila bryophytorum]
MLYIVTVPGIGVRSSSREKSVSPSTRVRSRAFHRTLFRRSLWITFPACRRDLAQWRL